jgi:SAM-dependent methyltransferase
MRRDVLELRTFYATPLGRAVRAAVMRQLVAAWGDAAGLDVLGLGYATPFLDPFRPRARRVVAGMPAGQGVETWPAQTANLACLTPEDSLPFPSALFDRVLVVHGLEEAPALDVLLAEVHRVLAPSGRVILAVVNRAGLWAGAEKTPFGHGRPFTRGQLERAVSDAELSPTAWSRALYAPPWPVLAPYAELIEQTFALVAPPVSGLILMEAVKQTFAVKPRHVGCRVAAPALRPAVAGSGIRLQAEQ